MPEIVPEAGSSVSPVGNWPETTLQVTALDAPVSCRVIENAAFCTKLMFGLVVMVITSAGGGGGGVIVVVPPPPQPANAKRATRAGPQHRWTRRIMLLLRERLETSVLSAGTESAKASAVPLR